MEFLKIWEVILRRKWIIVGVFFLFFSSVVIGTHFVIATYEANAKLIAETSETLSSLLENLGFENIELSSDDYDTVIALAQIRPLLEKLITSLQLKDRNGELMETDDLVEWRVRDLIFPRPYIKVDEYEDAAIIEIVSKSSDSSEAANMSNTLAEFFVNDTIARAKNEYRSAKIFLENQSQKAKEDYNIALTEFRDFLITNGVVDLPQETENLIDKIADLQDDYDNNENMIQQLKKEIAEVEEKLKNTKKFRKESEDLALNEEMKTLKAKVNELLVNIAGTSVSIYKAHPDYQESLKKIETAKELLKNEAETVLNNRTFSIDPIYDDLSQKLVSSYISREVALIKREVLQQYLNKYEQKLQRIPAIQAEYSKREGLLSVKRALYLKLLEYLTQVGMAESITVSNIRLVEPAVVPDEPDFPKKTPMFVLGFLLGWFWGVAAALFIDYLDNTVKTPEELKQASSLRLLGLLPKTRQLKHLKPIAKLAPSSPIVEAFRIIRNNIRRASGDTPVKTFVITSSVEGEGKSSIALNLAISYSMEGNKVVLIDLNLRKPVLYKLFDHAGQKRGDGNPKKPVLRKMYDRPEQKGLTNVITKGSKLTKSDVRTPIEDLCLLASGPIPHDPGRLVESQTLKSLIHRIKKQFDIVIIDTPPTIAFNDSMIVGELADGIIVVVEAGRVTLPMIVDVYEQLEHAGLNVIGTVLNKFKSYGVGYSSYKRVILGK